MDYDSNKTIFFICNDPERALGLEHIIENYHIVCCDNSPLVEIMIQKGINIFSLGRIENKSNPTFRNSNKLLENKKVQEYIKQNTPKGQKPNIVVFKVSLQMEKTCKRLNYNLLNTTSALNKRFELKISQYNNLKTLTSAFPKTIISALGKTTYTNIKSKLGEQFVIQYNRGHTGNSTVFIENEKEFIKEKKKFRNRLARIAEYIEGDIYTVNACITRFGIAYGGLSYQITGLEELTSKKGGTIGNDWKYPEKLTDRNHRKIKDILLKIEKELLKSGYKGMFGIDFIVTPKNKVYLIEINARQPASTPMHTKLMLNEEFIPLQAFHFAEFLFKENTEYIRFLNKYFNKGLAETNMARYIQEQNKLSMIAVEASQIFVRNTQKNKQKVVRNITQGIYNLNKETFSKTSQGYNIQDIIPGEFLILSTQLGQYVSPDNEIARIQTLTGVIDKKGKLKNNMVVILQILNKKIKLEDEKTA